MTKEISGLLCFLLTLPALAGPLAVVDAVQMPAWRDRGERSEPMSLGMEVKNGDRLRTGDGARAYVKLADGSVLKLGEAASVGLFSHSLRPERNLKGALDVAKGAFRFTTDALRRAGASRELGIRVGVATVGIRGTDLWGKSDEERDLVCLLEGRIEVSHAGSSVAMDQALTYFVVPKNAAALPLGRVDADELQRWAEQTEISAGAGATRAGGKWKVLLAVAEDEKQALATYDQVREAGYAARVRPLTAGAGKWNYQILIAGLASQQEAAQLATRVQAATGLTAAPLR